MTPLRNIRGRARAGAALASAAVMSVGICGCAPASPPPAPVASPSASAPAATPTSVAAAPSASPTSTPGSAQSGVSNGAHYTVSTPALTGSTPDHIGSWTLTVGQIAGGDPAVATAFNKAAIASANGQLDQVHREAGPDRWTFTTTPIVTLRAAAVTQLLTGVYYAHGAAHPISYPSTVVIDSRTARPVTLGALFTDEQAGLRRLSDQTRTRLHIQTTNAATHPDFLGTAPQEQNFANWIPTNEGIQISFADGQIGPGLQVVTVPWQSVTDLLNPGMAALATP